MRPRPRRKLAVPLGLPVNPLQREAPETVLLAEARVPTPVGRVDKRARSQTVDRVPAPVERAAIPARALRVVARRGAPPWAERAAV